MARILLIDLDGVLTTGSVQITSTGEKTKSFSSRDSRAIAEFVSRGYEVHIVTASKWPGSRHYAENLQVGLWVMRDKSQLDEITNGQAYYAVGDDVWDLRMLEGAERAFCPADSFSVVKTIKDIHVLETKGGRGVIAELALLLLPQEEEE